MKDPVIGIQGLSEDEAMLNLYNLYHPVASAVTSGTLDAAKATSEAIYGDEKIAADRLLKRVDDGIGGATDLVDTLRKDLSPAVMKKIQSAISP